MKTHLNVNLLRPFTISQVEFLMELRFRSMKDMIKKIGGGAAYRIPNFVKFLE